MKQRIDIKQLTELTHEQKLKLHSVWEPQKGDHYSWYKSKGIVNKESYVVDFNFNGLFADTEAKLFALPLLSIGQMIELLKTNEWNLEILELSGDFRVANDVHNGNAYSREELSDALWEACKSILKESEGK